MSKLKLSYLRSDGTHRVMCWHETPHPWPSFAAARLPASTILGMQCAHPMRISDSSKITRSRVTKSPVASEAQDRSQK
jgi:hypothetical protein